MRGSRFESLAIGAATLALALAVLVIPFKLTCGCGPMLVPLWLLIVHGGVALASALLWLVGVFQKSLRRGAAYITGSLSVFSVVTLVLPPVCAIRIITLC